MTEEQTDFPLGPTIQSLWNKLSEMRSLTLPSDPDAARKILAEELKACNKEWFVDDTLVQVIDELVAMDFMGEALSVWSHWRDIWPSGSFQGELALGVAAMLEGDAETAEQFMTSAHEAAPKEPAPYVNLAKIHLFKGDPLEAEAWCINGLKVEANNLKLWDVYGEVCLALNPSGAPSDIEKTALSFTSWAGRILAAQWQAEGPEDPSVLKVAQDLYSTGERDASFLVEYTALLGSAGDYESIPLVVFEASSKGSLPWQLHLHAAQAQLALDRPLESVGAVDAALAGLGQVPESEREQVTAMLEALKQEAITESGRPGLN